MVVIEHNLDVIKTADYIIDLGPEGGDGGGTIVCTGTPEEVAACERSLHRAVSEKDAGAVRARPSAWARPTERTGRGSLRENRK